MSTFIDGWVACATCAHRFPAEVAEAVHAATRPELRDAIIEGEFHRFMCPLCGGSTTIEKLFAYTDFDRSHWFVVVPGAELPFVGEWEAFAERTFEATMVKQCAPWVRDVVGPRMVRRVVFGLASLREKLLSFAAGLDDRALEVMKLGVLRRGGVLPVVEEHLHLVGLGGDVLFLCHARAGGSVSFSVPMSWYVEAEAAVARSGEGGLMAGRLVVDYRALLLAREDL